MASDPPFQVHVREIRDSDRAQHFEGSGRLAGHLTIEYLVGFQDPLTGRKVLVAELQGLIVGAIALISRPPTLHVEYLSRNGALNLGVGVQVGAPLLHAAEAYGLSVGAMDLTLEAVDEPAVVEFYRREGFRESSPPFFEAGWGVLHPMRKPLRPPP